MENTLTNLVRASFAKFFMAIFLFLAAAIVLSLIRNILIGISEGEDVMQIFLNSINTGIIGLAVFELAFIINTEYSNGEDDRQHIINRLRRTIPRFIGTVCVALSLEGLIMVIKYSQLELAGNLYYPVAIIVATAFLLTALGLFVHFTKNAA